MSSECKCGRRKHWSAKTCRTCYSRKITRGEYVILDDDASMEEIEALIAAQRPTMPADERLRINQPRQECVTGNFSGEGFADYRVVRMNRRHNGSVYVRGTL